MYLRMNLFGTWSISADVVVGIYEREVYGLYFIEAHTVIVSMK